LPLKILQSNDRVAEVQFICDHCGKIARTSLITEKETEVEKAKKITCCQCKPLEKSKQ